MTTLRASRARDPGRSRSLGIWTTGPLTTLALLTAPVAWCLVSSALAADPQHTFIQGAGAHPGQLRWSTNLASGRSVDVSWSRWGGRRAVGLGRTRLCLAAATGGACTPFRAARIFASRRRSFTGPEGGEYHVYCRVTVRGHLDPAEADRVITVVARQGAGYPCD